MIFTPEQINELLEIIEYHHILFSVKHFGKPILTDREQEILLKHKIDTGKLDTQNYSETAYKFGVIARAIGDGKAKKLKYNDFKKWIRSGGHIPLTNQEQLVINSLKQKTYGHLKDLGQKIGSDVRNTLENENQKRRAQVEKLISKELIEGAENRKALKEIMSNLAKKTEDWGRDWGRIVETELHNAEEEGRAADIKKNSTREDPLVYKLPFPGACRHCIKAYLTNGLGSRPIVFKLSQLMSNGTNIGVNQKEWKPVLGSMHPFCRCPLEEVPEGFIWDENLRMFVLPKSIPKVERKSKVRIQIGSEIYYV